MTSPLTPLMASLLEEQRQMTVVSSFFQVSLAPSPAHSQMTNWMPQMNSTAQVGSLK